MTEDTISKEGWDTIAWAFQDRYKIKISPIVYSPFGPTEEELNLLGDVTNKRIIDIGAGGGQKAIYLAKKGADITAFDISNKQLEFGHNLALENHIELKTVQGDFQIIDTYFPPNSFDIGYSIFALQYSKNHNILKKAFKGIFNILKEDGVFVFSLDHPFRSMGYWDTEQDKYILDNYFNREENTWSYDFPENNSLGLFTGSCWTLSDMLNSFVEAGFKLEKILEPQPIKREEYFDLFGQVSRYGIDNQKDPFNYKNLLRIPGTIIIKGVVDEK